jgi:hypothetical protein
MSKQICTRLSYSSQGFKGSRLQGPGINLSVSSKITEKGKIHMRKDIVISGVVIASLGAVFILGSIWLRNTGDIYDRLAQAQGSQNVLLIGISALIFGVVMVILGRMLQMNVANE